MNSFFRPTLLDWTDALPAFSTLLPQDDIAANVCGEARIVELTTNPPGTAKLGRTPENPLFESPPAVSTQTPWVTETSLQTRGTALGTGCASGSQLARCSSPAR